MTSPLSGIRVLDLSQAAAGPFCSMMLGDMGAEIIKIEVPKRGDPLRRWGPPFQGDEGVYFLDLNRNKKSITLNLKSQKGKEIFFQLAKNTDIILVNFRPGTAKRLGVDYQKLKAMNPRLIYCRISGYGHEGPYSDRGGYDLITQGESGMMIITGEPGRPPVKFGVAIIDLGTGMYAAYGILLALYSRKETGRGQLVDLTLFDSAVTWMLQPIGSFLATGIHPKPLGSAHPVAAPYSAYKTKDIYITIGCAIDRHFRKLCEIIDRVDLADDPRFVTNPKRVENKEELNSILSEIFITKKSDEWLKAFREAGIPYGPVNTLEKVVADPQLQYRDMIVELEHPTAGRIKMPGIPVKLSETPGKIALAPPTLGQHTDEILRELGYSDGDIQELKADNVV